MMPTGAVTHYSIPMDQILDTTVINPSGMDTTAYGQVELVNGVRGQAIQLDAKNSYIRVAGPGHRYECFGDLDICPMGKIRLDEIKAHLYMALKQLQVTLLLSG